MSTSNIGPKFSFTTAFTEAYIPVGTTYWVSGRGYVFLKNGGADSTAAGDVCSIFSVSAFTYGSFSVTAATIADLSDGTTTRALVAGVCGAVIALNEYGWLWFAGYGTHSITTDTNVAVYNGLVCADGAKVASPNTTAATAHWGQFGTSCAADSGSALTSAALGGPGMFPWGNPR